MRVLGAISPCCAIFITVPGCVPRGIFKLILPPSIVLTLIDYPCMASQHEIECSAYKLYPSRLKYG